MAGGVQAARALVNRSILYLLKKNVERQVEASLLSPGSLDSLLSSEGLDSLLSEVCIKC